MKKLKMCTAYDCGRPPKAKGLCMKHYMRVRKHGSAEATLVPQEQHGMSKTPEYHAWRAMKRRCYWRPGKEYGHYGGRNIEVCSRWRQSFLNFLEDMGRRPSDSHSLDRIDNNGDYSPDNCRWATKQEQVLNRRIVARSQAGYYGVTRSNSGKRWRCKINYLGVLHVGTFDTPEEAAWMYDQWAISLHGDEANLNFEYI